MVCQECGLVPIVELEMLTDGGHDIKTCTAATEKVLAAVYKALNDYHVLLEGTLLKPNMLTPGSDSPKVGAEEIAEYTVTRRSFGRCRRPCRGSCSCPAGRARRLATQNLNAVNKLDVLSPWTLSFSFGRALQQSTIKKWGGKKENVLAAQAARSWPGAGPTGPHVPGPVQGQLGGDARGVGRPLRCGDVDSCCFGELGCLGLQILIAV